MPIKFPTPPITRTAPSAASQSASTQAAVTAFRDCFDRYQDCLEYRDSQESASLNEDVENYILDFELSAKRASGADNAHQQLFRQMFVEQRTAAECERTLKMDSFTLARKRREVESLVGAALVRRGLFPLNRYFRDGSSKTSETPANLSLLAA